MAVPLFPEAASRISISMEVTAAASLPSSLTSSWALWRTSPTSSLSLEISLRSAVFASKMSFTPRLPWDATLFKNGHKNVLIFVPNESKLNLSDVSEESYNIKSKIYFLTIQTLSVRARVVMYSMCMCAPLRHGGNRSVNMGGDGKHVVKSILFFTIFCLYKHGAMI